MFSPNDKFDKCVEKGQSTEDHTCMTTDTTDVNQSESEQNVIHTEASTAQVSPNVFCVFYIQSWPKWLQFFQKIKYCTKKSTALTRVFL